ncbi:MAG: hypothetical protein ACK5MT_18740 [Actinomycetales bacterium]
MKMAAENTRRSSDQQLEQLSRQLRALAEPFTQWAEAGVAAAAGFDQVERPLLVGLGLMQRLNDANPVGWRPVQLAEALDRLTGQEGARAVVGSLLLYTRFLADTGRWVAVPADLEFSVKLLEAEIAGEQAGPDLTESEEIEGLRDVTAVHEVIALLDWVGPGRALTATGGLRLVDVVEVSSLIGEPVATTKAAATEDELVVRSMWEAPALSLAWVTALRAGLLETVGRRVLVTAAGRDILLEDDDAPGLQALRQLVSAYVLTMLEAAAPETETGDETGAAEQQEASTTQDREAALSGAAGLAVVVLARAVTGSPLTRPMVTEAGLAFGVEDEAVSDELANWRACGLLEIGEYVEVPAAARPAMAAGLLAWGVDPEELPLPAQS